MKLEQVIIEGLAIAFGGDSQVPDDVVGMAIIAHCNNGQLTHATDEDRKAVFIGAWNLICERWEDVQQFDPVKVKTRLLTGAWSARWDPARADRFTKLLKELEQQTW